MGFPRLGEKARAVGDGEIPITVKWSTSDLEHPLVQWGRGWMLYAGTVAGAYVVFIEPGETRARRDGFIAIDAEHETMVCCSADDLAIHPEWHAVGYLTIGPGQHPADPKPYVCAYRRDGSVVCN